MKANWIAGCLSVATALALAAPAFAEDSIYVPLFTYRTGPFAGSGTPIADGMHDYLTMLNERDGGIGGVKLAVDECETGYDTKKGLECYDTVKPKNPVIINPWSTGITLSLIPKASVDKIPILSMAYGLSAAARGDVFPWVFNPPATYWDGASEILKYLGGGSIEALKGKTIGYLYFDAAFGREALPFFKSLSAEAGFDFVMSAPGLGVLLAQCDDDGKGSQQEDCSGRGISPKVCDLRFQVGCLPDRNAGLLPARQKRPGRGRGEEGARSDRQPGCAGLP